jgi:hypothetical protein
MPLQRRLAARLRAGGVALALSLALAGCAAFDRAMEISFPPEVPGLPADEPWVALPIGGWVHDGGVSADAIEACFAGSCPQAGAVGVFRAEGEQAAALAEIAAHPDLLKTYLEQRSRQPKGRRKPQPVTASLEPLAAGRLRGFALRLSRTDGSRAAYGALLVSPAADGRLTALIVFAADPTALRRLAEGVAARLG